MSAAEAVLRVLEELRQTALTERLGQVTCSSDGLHGLWTSQGAVCSFCKAVV